MFAITGATGQLGRLVIDELLEKVHADQIVAAVRSPEKAVDLAARGVVVREADYDRPETLCTAFDGVERVLLISSDAVGTRLRQHQAVIDAAQKAGVRLLGYTSILHADASPSKLAEEHHATELAIAASGIPVVILRNGWYTENHLMGLSQVLEHGVMVGAAGDGRFSSAARADYAAAAAIVLMAEDQAGEVHELAGDHAYTLTDFAAELTRQAGTPVAYQNLSQAAYKHVLVDAGLPEPVADALADEDAVSSADALFNGSGALSKLIGRATTPMPETIAAALRNRSAV